ncbi:MAG: helix-turn-helix domain-containing protein [Pseudobdellovibrio sp.]
MPWKESNVMNERMRFISRILEGETMTELCREFQISRKTGYKIWNRYESKGVDGLIDENKRPFTNPNQTSDHVINLILAFKFAIDNVCLIGHIE